MSTCKHFTPLGGVVLRKRSTTSVPFLSVGKIKESALLGSNLPDMFGSPSVLILTGSDGGIRRSGRFADPATPNGNRWARLIGRRVCVGNWLDR